MTRDAFRRLALFTGSCLFWLGIWIIAVVWGWPAALFVALMGLAFGSMLTFEWSPEPSEPSGRFRRFGKPEDDEEDEDLTEHHA